MTPDRDTPIEELEKLAFFSTCYESLDAINTGMNLTGEGTSLAICGSGDAPLAILEGSENVVAIDNNPIQLMLAQKRTDMIRNSDYDTFRSAGSNKRSEYFTDERLDRIRENIDGLEHRTEELFELSDSILQERFTRIYLSNAIKYTKSTMTDPSQAEQAVDLLFECLTPGGLIYTAVAEPEVNSHQSARINERLTLAAQSQKQHPYWEPHVVEKIC